jgi:hypothetical protein
MSRSGYSDDFDSWDLIRYRGRVASAIRGKRGQKLLLDLVHALDAMPIKRLITKELECDGEVCSLGAIGQFRGVYMAELDPENPESVAHAFDIADCLAREVVFENDENGSYGEMPERRWERMRAWAVAQLQPVDLVEVPNG